MNIKQSVCLNMIVKNESKGVLETLKNILSKITIHYYVICDTGSTDNTVELIKTFFEKSGIPGEIHYHEWIDFGTNRTLAVQNAYKKADYILIFDADDRIVGDFKIPFLTHDSYLLNFGTEFVYSRKCLIKADILWKYVGVLHEYITTCEDNMVITESILHGDYHIVSGRTGSRNKDPEKYSKDAKLLENAYYDSKCIDDPIYNRYAFYCANSYCDAHQDERAIEWYLVTLKSNGWYEEKYVSCLKLYQLTKNREYLVKSYHYNPRRIEGLYLLIQHHTCEGEYSIAWNYYSWIREYYENEYPSECLTSKLFCNVFDYTFYLPYYIIIVCGKTNKIDIALKMFTIIFEKLSCPGQWWIDNLFYNLQFFIEHFHSQEKVIFIGKMKMYILFLKRNGYTVKENSKKCKLEETSKKILIYTGFMYFPWNDTYVSNNPIGGAEKAVCYLARYLPKDYEIIISGDVIPETIGNITYINRHQLSDLLKTERFHTIIVSRYVSFFDLYPEYTCYQLFLSAHDSTGFINNFNNESVDSVIRKNIQFIDGVIALSTWHKNNIIEHHMYLKDKIHMINNGILPEIFPKGIKVKNKFVWTSCSYRGLDVLLDLWEQILFYLPDATLDISSYDTFPKNESDEGLLGIINKYPSIVHHGKCNTHELNNLISKAEYWLYTNTFPETSCITGLEMLMSEVICLYYPLAGLLDTVGKYGIQVTPGKEIESILSLTEEKKDFLRIQGKEYATKCSWKNRAKEWSNVLKIRDLIIDCFIFYNELEMLKYRLSVLNDHVDYFIIVESSRTFTGNEKELFFENNKHSFNNSKIIHIIVDDFPFHYPTDRHWDNETFQRNCISRGLEKITLKDSDYILISDVDEIPDIDILRKIKTKELILDIATLEQDFYYYNLECKMNKSHNLSKIVSYKKFKELKLCDHIRNYTNCNVIKKGGWHLSYFGDSSFISNKIKNFSHQEYNKNMYTDTSLIEQRIKNGTDLFDRGTETFTIINIQDNNYLPPKYEEICYDFKISYSWFNNSELKKYIINNFDKNKEYSILEIGSFEGCSACFFSDTLDISKMVCVDPFVSDGSDKVDHNELKSKYYKNIKFSKNYKKIETKEIFSDDFFNENETLFDFIYVDGEHSDKQIKNDLDNSLKYLNDDGIIWCDDYNEKWKKTFLDWIQTNNVYVIHDGYQLGLKKRKEISLCVYGQFRSWNINLENNMKELEILFNNYIVNVFILTDKKESGNYSIDNENKIKDIFEKYKSKIHFIKYIEDFDLFEEQNASEYFYNNCKHSRGKHDFVPNLMYRKNLLNNLKNQYISSNKMNIHKHFYIRLFDMKISKRCTDNKKIIESIDLFEISGSHDSFYYGSKEAMDYLFNINFKIYQDEIWDDKDFYDFFLSMDHCLCTLKHTYAPEVQYAAHIYYSKYKYNNIRFDYNNVNNIDNLFNVKHCPNRK